MDMWYDLELYEQDDETIIKEYDITSTPNDFNISTLFNLIDNGIIKMPLFQRNYVWDKKRASRLIESIILGLPIPQVFLYEKGKNNFYVIDGQQRLLSIYFFMKQRFPTKEGRAVLREFLTGDETINQKILSDDKYFVNFSLYLPSMIATEKNKFDKLKYETLGEAKHTFDYIRTIRSVVIKQTEPDDEDSSMFEVFNRLNTGGQNLTSQEIRMSLFYSDFYRALIELNKRKKWRELLGQETVDLHFKDIEILVRAFAMLFLHSNYQGTMTRFLNKFSKSSNGFDITTIEYLKDLFEGFLMCCSNLNNEDFCSKSGKFSISLFESVFVATCFSSFSDKEIVKGNISKGSIEELKKDAEFIDSTQEGIASKKSVDTRMRRAKDIIVVE